MDFAGRKAAALAALSSPTPDKSPKGGVDAPIAPLLDVLNSHPDLLTTSSCSGRVSILAQPQEGQGPKQKKKARGGGWVYVSHDPADPDAVVELLFGGSGSGGAGDELVFRFEPMIVAVECRDAAAAVALVAAAVGITSLQKRAMVAIRCSIRMEVPLGQAGELVVSPEYVRYIVKNANIKMEANKKRMDGFLDLLRTKGLPGSLSHCNGSGGLYIDRGTSLYSEIKTPFDDSAKKNGEYLVTTKSDVDYKNSDADGDCEVRSGSLEALYFENQDLACSKGVKHGFEMNFKDSPSPRMGHTITAVGNSIYVIGGRGGPSEILDDIWVLQSTEHTWSRLVCSGNFFHPRHRHAAAAAASKIFVYGGLSNEGIYSCMNVLDTESMQWSVLAASGEWPCARHSHSMVSYGSKLFMFGGHDGQRALIDLYSFDIITLRWNKETTTGRTPTPRFSHCMFIYKSYLGILGGCPITDNNQEVMLLNLKHRVWFCVSIPSLSQSLCVRSSSVVIEDDLVIVSGGASCYAFGTKFNQPIIIDLHPIESMFKHDDMVIQSCNTISTVDCTRGGQNGKFGHVIDAPAGDFTESGPQVLQLEKKFAKLAKDILKKFGWLDLARKVRVSHDNCHVLCPVTTDFHDLYTDEHLKMAHNDLSFGESLVFTEKNLVGDNLSLQKALEILLSFHGSFLKDELAISRKPSKSPQVIMKELVSLLLEKKGMPPQLLEQLPTRWETLGNIIILPKTCFKDSLWESVSEELWPLVAKALSAQRLARQGKIMPNGTRDSTLELLRNFAWDSLIVEMRVVDLFAGIGYFVLPFLVKANAKLVYACEWNPHALMALRRNVSDNHVADRCIVLEGDNRVTAPKGVADRVCLGLLPSSECSWTTAVAALRGEGGILHIHGNVNDSDETSWLEHVVESISNIARAHGLSWNVTVEHVERVKWYGPHIRHLVVDVRCRPI
ncbi:hypothetical protein PR202_gb20963 [Eleusine coracana subsp. coracana]|uniref:SAM-dependent methyltransferase TRM5/TYW2-type domain-containing protein n=1 Tax=Eleusine coracana subsp. coracana TaxID=191504 RepID=A0AAV5FBW5_ELECO|nr:hypothetical protein PR202_gb20963 [Eleusine coracana subsp. coracana]